MEDGARPDGRRRPDPEVSLLGEAVLRGEHRIEDVEDRFVDRSRLFHTQDYVAQVGQGAIVDRSKDHLGHNDIQVTMLRNILRREILAQEEGRPLKEWVCPAPLEARVARPACLTSRYPSRSEALPI